MFFPGLTVGAWAQTADLEVTKTLTSPVLAPGFGLAAGETVVYTIGVKNTGPSDADGVVLDDQIPSGSSFVSNSGDCVGSFPCSLGTIPSGETRTVTSTFLVESPVTPPEPYL